jgi:hypothetical protein
MSDIRYTEYKKKQPGGRYVWGVLRLEGRKQNFGTVGEGEGTRRKAKRLARQLNEIEGAPAETSDRFLSWHEPGEPLLLDRTVCVGLAALSRAGQVRPPQNRWL